jgi:hypothetical protein
LVRSGERRVEQRKRFGGNMERKRIFSWLKAYFMDTNHTSSNIISRDNILGRWFESEVVYFFHLQKSYV